jgi:hypothetical protein
LVKVTGPDWKRKRRTLAVCETEGK